MLVTNLEDGRPEIAFYWAQDIDCWRLAYADPSYTYTLEEALDYMRDRARRLMQEFPE
jgi:hypothetical protein